MPAHGGIRSVYPQKEKGQTYTFDKILKNKKRFGVASQKLNIWE
jgi:hypothetical protein